MNLVDHWTESSILSAALVAAKPNAGELKSGRFSACVCRPLYQGQIEFGSLEAETPVYPASVVKLFHIAYILHLIDTGKVIATAELKRAMADMIQESCNDATALVVDTFSGACGGPELPPEEFESWIAKRRQIDHWFHGLGFEPLTASQKTWNERPYGRERQARDPNYENCNSLSPLHALQLMESLQSHRFPITPESRHYALQILSRLIPAESPDADSQSREYIGGCLPVGSKLWSKAGWTDEVRHDVAWIEGPGGMQVGLAIFTEGLSNQAHLIPCFAQAILQNLKCI